MTKKDDSEINALVEKLVGGSHSSEGCINFGAGHLVDLAHIEGIFDVSRAGALKILDALQIPAQYMGNNIYFSWESFRRILYVLTLPGTKPFVFPGSKFKNSPAYYRHKEDYLTQVTLEMVETAMSDDILKELKEASSRTIPNTLKSLRRAQNPTRAKRPIKPDSEDPPQQDDPELVPYIMSHSVTREERTARE